MSASHVGNWSLLQFCEWYYHVNSNGFILFSQVLLSLNVDACETITYPNQRASIEGFQPNYGCLNIDFFTTETLSFCLWPKATTLDMLVFKYITITYALSLVTRTIWFINKCGGSCLKKWYKITKLKSSVIICHLWHLGFYYSQSILVSHSSVNGV